MLSKGVGASEQGSKGVGARDGAVVRAFASLQYGPGSNPGVDAICGLSLLLVLPLAPRGFLRVLRFSPLLKNQHFQIPIRSGTHGHVSTSSYELLSDLWVNKLQFAILQFTVNKGLRRWLITRVADAANGLEECVGRLQCRLMVHDKIGILYFSGQSGVELCFPVRRQISLHAQRMQFTKCCYRRYGISLHQHEQLTH